jgi:hypothetical protein
MNSLQTLRHATERDVRHRDPADSPVFIGNFMDACLLDRCHTACMDCASVSDLDTADRDALLTIFALEVAF